MYKKLLVYQRAYQQALEVHQISQTFPQFERYELGGQLRRAAVSIALNIAEGYGRKDAKAEFQHFLRTAQGSCNEVLVLIELAKDLGYLKQEEYESLCDRYTITGKQIYRLRQSWVPRSND